MLTAKDLFGVCPMVVTPAKEGADRPYAVDTVDLETTARLTGDLIDGGIGSIAVAGTTGEGWGLTFEERKALLETVVSVSGGRVPVFAGSTTLNTRETVAQMRAFRDMGADGAFVGLPLWQTPTLENSVGFYADLSEAVPDLPVMVYANAAVFKSSFPTEFWEGIARKAPTVICCKIAYGMDHLAADAQVAGHQVNFMPIDRNALAAREILGDKLTTVWSTAANMGPEPCVALMDAIAAGDLERAKEIDADIKSVRAAVPKTDPDRFPSFNAQAVKAAVNASGYANVGPFRPPYTDFPDDWREAAEARGKGWAELRKRYVKVSA